MHDPGSTDAGPMDDVARVVRPRRRARSSTYRGGRGRPGAGQARGRASRGWHPDTIVAAYLVADENVELEETQSVRGFLLNQVIWIVLALVAATIISVVAGTPGIVLAMIGLIAFAAYITTQALQAWFTRYVVTDLRVLRVNGVLNRHAEFIPWGKVTDMSRTESLFQWWAHTATIRIESANENSSFRAINDVDDPDNFYRVLVEMVDGKQGRVAHPRAKGDTRRI